MLFVCYKKPLECFGGSRAGAVPSLYDVSILCYLSYNRLFVFRFELTNKQSCLSLAAELF